MLLAGDAGPKKESYGTNGYAPRAGRRIATIPGSVHSASRVCWPFFQIFKAAIHRRLSRIPRGLNWLLLISLILLAVTLGHGHLGSLRDSRTLSMVRAASGGVGRRLLERPTVQPQGVRAHHAARVGTTPAMPPRFPPAATAR